jgi:O-acetyl-ADP-ribose deacetylase (regulator of RNase III)
MQDELHQFLARSGKAFVQPGEVVACGPHGLPVKAVLHAVAVDAFYQSSPQIVHQVVEKSLQMAAGLGARRVALTALATGFGRLSMEKFAEGILPLRTAQYRPLNEVVVCVKNADDCERLGTSFAAGT